MSPSGTDDRGGDGDDVGGAGDPPAPGAPEAAEPARADDDLAALGHELRNPLAALYHGLVLAERIVPAHSPAARYHGMMRRQVALLRRLADDLLDLSRVRTGRLRVELGPLDLCELVRAEVEAHAPGRDANLRVRTALPEGPVWILGDGSRVAQIVSNLLGNACKFTEAYGDVLLEVERGPGPSLRVKDDGVGMDEETLGRLFEPFQQGRRTLGHSRAGLGLGLAICQRLARHMGAEIPARSDGPGKGAEFVVRFQGATSPAAGDPAVPGLGTRPLRILVVDDDRDVASGFAEYLSRVLGHEVETAHDGVHAFDLAHGRRPDVVFCDVDLPRLNGLELARALRAERAFDGSALFAVTGYGGVREQDEARRAGFDAHFTKPLDVDAVRKLLADLALGSPRRA